MTRVNLWPAGGGVHADSPAPRTESLARKLLLLVLVLLLLLVLIAPGAIGYFRSGSTANCVNEILGTRNAPASADQQAHIDFGMAIKRAFHTPRTATAAQRSAAAVALQRAVDSYVSKLVTDQRQRTAHPLGEC